MKINKVGFFITFTLSIASFCVLFIHYQWISNFAFAILGSGLISAFICLINYFLLRKNMIEEVSRHFYKLANTYNLLVCNIQSQREIVINDFCDEINSFMNCCEKNYDNSRGMFRICKKERFFCETIIKLSEEIVDLEFRYKNCIAFLYSDLKNNNNTDSSIEYFKAQVKMSLRTLLTNIIKIESAFYSKKDLDYKIERRKRFEDELGSFTNPKSRMGG